MKIIQQTHRVHTKIDLLHFYFQKISKLEYNKHAEKESILKINSLKRCIYYLSHPWDNHRTCTPCLLLSFL